MERFKHYSHLLDEDGAFVGAMESLEHTIKYYAFKCTDFLTPDQVEAIIKRIEGGSGIHYTVHGGIVDAERSKVFFSPDPIAVEEIDSHIGIVGIQYSDKFCTLQHKDVLGALMALGVKRKKVGDIVPVDNGFQVALDKSLVSYILSSLEQIGRSGVKTRAVSLDSAATRSVKYTLMDATVKSLRLDAVIASAYHLSRADSQKKVIQEHVKVNHQIQVKCDVSILEGDLISVRGFGRFVVKEVGGPTKKDRLRLKLAMVSKEGGK